MRDALLYKITRPIITVLFKIVFRPKIEGLENIPKEGRLILAGNHTSNFDCLLLISSLKRNVHFLAKQELWKGPKKIVFANMGLIPVDRKNKSHNSLVLAKKYLESELVVGIFPEGTTEKEGHMLDFKMGTVKLAYDTNTLIVPFVITGRYKLINNGLKIKFLKPEKVGKELEKENKKLYNIIKLERG